MVWLAVDYNKTERIFTTEPSRGPYKTWIVTSYGNYIKLPKGSIWFYQKTDRDRINLE